MPLIQLKSINKTYHRGGTWKPGCKVNALCDVNLSVKAGESLAVIGPSGSGKSTLGRIVLGLERPDSGDVIYNGESFNKMSKSTLRLIRRDIQVVFQNSHGAVNPRFSCFKIIAEPLVNFDKIKGFALKDRVVSLMESVGLNPNMLQKKPHQLSGGELQRVCIARAIAANPKLIVLDEAVSSLDMLIQAQIIKLLIELKNTLNTAFIFISHDLKAVSMIADSLVLIESGRCEAYASDLNDPAQVAELKTIPAFIELTKNNLANPFNLPTAI